MFYTLSAMMGGLSGAGGGFTVLVLVEDVHGLYGSHIVLQGATTSKRVNGCYRLVFFMCRLQNNKLSM